MSTVPEAERTQPFPDFPQASSTRPSRPRSHRTGAIRWGSAFFGWLVAMTVMFVLGALATAAGTALGVVGPTLDLPAFQATGALGAAVLLAVIFAGYYCGGYVAGRMARFAGARQGVAVWLWTLFLAVVAAVIATVTGAVPSPSIEDLLRLPMGGGILSAGGAALTVGVLVVTLVGAVLGGLAGMRFHRWADRELVEH
jgi:hypothetical protein